MLTPRQTDILGFIRQCLETRGAPPTRAEIVTEFGFASPTAADDHLKALAKKGVIELVPGAARGIRLLEAVPIQHELPLIGRVAAGSPLLALENLEKRVPVDPSLFRPKADYLLRVQGESMQDIGIRDGDLLAVHKQSTARNGQIVVARVEDEVTVKRFQRKGDVVQLLPENTAFKPIRVSLARKEFSIEGLAVGLVRTGGFSKL